jgi:hypothetical protein
MAARNENQQRWQSWQAQQLETFNGAASRAEHDPKAAEAYTAKRQHVHLDKISRTLRKLRG